MTNFDDYVRHTVHVSDSFAANTWNAYQPGKPVEHNTIPNRRISLKLFGKGYRSELNKDDLVNERIKSLHELSDTTPFDVLVLPSASHLTLLIYHTTTGEYRLLGLSVCGKSKIIDAAGKRENIFTTLNSHGFPHLFIFTPDMSNQFHVHICLKNKEKKDGENDDDKKWPLAFYVSPSQYGSLFNKDHGTFPLPKTPEFFTQLFELLPGSQQTLCNFAATVKSPKSKLGYIFELIYMLILGGNEGGISGGTADIYVNGKSMQVKGCTIDKQNNFEITLCRGNVSYVDLDYMAFCASNITNNVIRFYAPMPIQMGILKAQFDAGKGSIGTTRFDSEGWPVSHWIPSKHFDLKLGDLLLGLHIGDLTDLVHAARDALGLAATFNRDVAYLPFGTDCKFKQQFYSSMLVSLLHDRFEIVN